MTQYIKDLALTAYSKAVVAATAFKLEAQRVFGGSLVTRLEKENARLRSDLKAMAKRNIDLNLALAGRNKRGNTEALIAGRTRFGEVVSDTALTYDEVAFPTLGIAAKVVDRDLVLTDLDPNREVSVDLYSRAEKDDTLVLRTRG